MLLKSTVDWAAAVVTKASFTHPPTPEFAAHTGFVPAPAETGTNPDVAVPVAISSATAVLKVGAAAAPLVGPANKVFAACVARTAVNVPLEVTGDPETVRKAGMDNATEVTVPVPVPGGTANVPSSRKNFAPEGVPLNSETTSAAEAATAFPELPFSRTDPEIEGIVGVPVKSE